MLAAGADAGAVGPSVGPRELPPWLLKQAGDPSSGSHSLSQEVSGEWKDVKDIKSSSLEDKKILLEVCMAPSAPLCESLLFAILRVMRSICTCSICLPRLPCNVFPMFLRSSLWR